MARAALNLSMRELAELSGLSLATIHKYETGKTISNLTTVELLRNALEKAGIEFLRAEAGRGEGARLRAVSRAAAAQWGYAGR